MAIWHNIDDCPDWAVIEVKRLAPGFGKGFTVSLGIDNTKPNESFEDCARRIADRFDCDQKDLVLTAVF
jgi:hypothetical protein